MTTNGAAAEGSSRGDFEPSTDPTESSVFAGSFLQPKAGRRVEIVQAVQLESMGSSSLRSGMDERNKLKHPIRLRGSVIASNHLA